LSALAPGATVATDSKEREAEPLPPGAETGTRLRISAFKLVALVLEPTSTVGRTLTTTSVASPWATANDGLSRNVTSARRAMPSCSLGK
jgi:hypothetical protein